MGVNPTVGGRALPHAARGAVPPGRGGAARAEAALAPAAPRWEPLFEV
jgi:hypothetical protein